MPFPLKKRPVVKCTLQGEPIQEYDSVSLAAFDNNISEASISNCIAKRQKSAAGFKWKYKK